jgi:hypothetical protein
MSIGSIARRVSIVLLLVLGGSGALVGLQLFGAMATVGTGPGGIGGWIAGAVLVYGLLLIASAIGLMTGRRWAWLAGSVTLATGIGVFLALVGIYGRDEILLGGVVIWTTVLACLGVARGFGRT